MSVDEAAAGTTSRAAAALRLVAINLVVCLVLASLPELAAVLLMRFPAPLTGHALRVFRQYYASHDRQIIQLLPDCAVYDPELTYLLRPPGCRIVNREHTVDYVVNRLGARDDEGSLDGPEIIVLGDSQAMGWGVGQTQTFSELLERETGSRVLNLAISSYGTVRELKLLDRADRSRLKTLVIQYCQNDAPENLAFESEGNRLPISDRAVYEKTVEDYLARTAYSPWKHTRRLVQIWRHLGAPWAPPDTVEEHLVDARAFLNALAESGIDLGGIEIVVFEVNGFARNDAYFTTALESTVEQLPPESPWRRVQVLDLSPELTEDKYYKIDDHLTAEGHRTIADALLPLLQASFPSNEPEPRP